MTADHIAALWVEMGALYAYRWLNSYGERDNGRWLHTLQDLTPDQLARGVARCERIGGDWPPTAPEFRRYCLPTADELGVPTLRAAYQEAVEGVHPHKKHEWSHPLVYHAAMKIGYWALLNRAESATFPPFREAYHLLLSRVMAGEDLSAPARPKLTTLKPRRTKTVAITALAAIKETLQDTAL